MNRVGMPQSYALKQTIAAMPIAFFSDLLEYL